MATNRLSNGWPGTGGSGPAAGVIAINNTCAVGALKNYFPRFGGVEFIYAPDHDILAAGRPKVGLNGSWHEQLALLISVNSSALIVGGMLSRGMRGEFLTGEQSGHFGDIWTPDIRVQFNTWLPKRTGILVVHHPWEAK